MNTFSRSGDSSCTYCPNGKFAPQGSSICWDDGRIGGKMKMSNNYAEFYLPAWIRAVANALQTEIEDINVLHTYSGSVYVDFDIRNPDIQKIRNDSTQIRRLSGNEKIVLLHQWWLTNDPRLADFPYNIENLQLFAKSNKPPYKVEELYVPSKPMESLIYHTFGDGNPVRSGFYFDRTTFQLDLTFDPNSSSTLTFSIGLLIISIALLLF